ncbi:hypothetical protein BJ170DRAFT_165774 [Xylariales sp. AK1849]|nr:hypothetical protein BJ170DRAFT_165774 [Xylariales sp. AK1849]
MDTITISADLTPPDVVVLRNLASDIRLGRDQSAQEQPTNGHIYTNGKSSRSIDPAPQNDSSLESSRKDGVTSRSSADIAKMIADNDPASKDFEPTIFVSIDHRDLRSRLHPVIYKYILQPYVSWARHVVRTETDVVMVTHLILYFATSVPSALWLFHHFTYLHGVLHTAMQFYYMGTYTLMMHQHIHARGILAKRLGWSLFDSSFPYILDPLMGHTWNTYYYHHVKHHHIEGNGRDDLSSTIRYQRDDIFNFLHYLGRFFFLVWLDLPLYFLRKSRPSTALRVAFWEIGNYAVLYALFKVDKQATTFVFLLPLLLMRIGLMVGNWGQHAFVDPDEPDSDYRSSITLIDVPSNRYCFNDGYHTSHHLNPMRHWRNHPVHFLQNKEVYAQQQALTFHNIDYLMITVRLMLHDYEHLAKCLVPMGEQIGLTMEEKVAMLKRRTEPFSEEDIKSKFGKPGGEKR